LRLFGVRTVTQSHQHCGWAEV